MFQKPRTPVVLPLWQMMPAGLLRTESSLCSLCFRQAVRPGTTSSLPSRGWWTRQMASGGKRMKILTFLRISLVTSPRDGTSRKPTASNVSSGAVWVGSVEVSCVERDERALGISCAASGTRSRAAALPPPRSPRFTRTVSACPAPILLRQPVRNHDLALAECQAPRIFSQEETRGSLCIPSKAVCKVGEITNWTWCSKSSSHKPCVILKETIASLSSTPSPASQLNCDSF